MGSLATSCKTAVSLCAVHEPEMFLYRNRMACLYSITPQAVFQKAIEALRLLETMG